MIFFKTGKHVIIFPDAEGTLVTVPSYHPVMAAFIDSRHVVCQNLIFSNRIQPQMSKIRFRPTHKIRNP